jgi:hypothetical protein
MDDTLEQVRAGIKRLRLALTAFSKTFPPLPAPPSGTDAALTSLYLRIASLANTGLLACAESEIYAARALVRCVAEHWMRLMSIVAGSAPFEFFGELKEAEAVDIDRRMRNCFPNGQIPADMPAPVRSAIAGALRSPPPTADEHRRAKEIVQKYQFDKLCSVLLASLKVGDGKDDASGYGTMAFAYARFSGCVHGGPLGHDYLAPSPSATVVWWTAADLLAAWASALTLVLAKFRGPEDSHTKAALAIQSAIFAQHLPL